MSRHRQSLLLMLLTTGCVACFGCAGKAERKAWDRYADFLSPRVGESKVDEFVQEWGMPDSRIELDDGYACNWHFSKGSRSVGFSYFVSVGEARETYDDVLLMFDDEHTLRSWRVECER
ncbi:MAG: hypothetical protein ABIG44_08710 [Planctomycetota bacterium]